MLNRREAIVLSAKGVAALMASMPFLTGCREKAGPAADTGSEDSLGDGTDSGTTYDTGNTDTASDGVDWDTFLAELSELADQQFSSDWDQETYVEEVAALMLLLDLDDAQFEALYDGYAQAAGDFPELSTAHDGGHFEVVTIEFNAGDRIDLHNHPDMTGVIFGISGSVDIEAFNLLEEQSTNGNLLIERTSEVTVRGGDIATLTAERGNIHALVATEYTELLDVFTPPYDAERIERYRWYERADEPYSGDDIYEAWEA